MKILAALLLAIVFAATPVLAQRTAANADAAAAQVSKATGGRVVNVQTVERNGKTVYRVRVLLPDGKVRTVDVAGR